MVGLVRDTNNLYGTRAIAVSGAHAFVASNGADSMFEVDVYSGANPTLVGVVRDTNNC